MVIISIFIFLNNNNNVTTVCILLSATSAGMLITEGPSDEPVPGIRRKDSTSLDIAATPFGIIVISVILTIIAIMIVKAIKQKGESTK